MPCGCIKSLSRTDIKHKSIYISLSMPKFYSWYLTHGPLWRHMSHMKNNNKRNKTKQKNMVMVMVCWLTASNHYQAITSWRHQMETLSALLATCAGNSPVPGEFPHKGQWRGALMFSLICAWIKVSKQWRGWWFETLSRPLWRHRNDLYQSWRLVVVGVKPLFHPMLAYC